MGMIGTTPRTPITPLLWYIVWSMMLLVAAVKTLAHTPILSGKADLTIGALVALFAAALMLRKSDLLSRRESALSIVLLVTFCTMQLLHFAISLKPPSPSRGVDFSAYYLAGKVVSENPAESLYVLPLLPDGRMNLNAETSASSPWSAAAVRYQVPFAAPYIYPPLLAVLMMPMVHLPFATALATWNILTILLAAASLFLTLDAGRVRLNPRLALILGVGLFSYYPLIDNLFFGQIGGVILFLLAAGVWLLTRGRITLSALSFALATAIKLTPILAVPVLIFHRKWRWLAAYAAWMFALLLLSLGQAGWPAHQQFWHKALPSIASGTPVCQNLSLIAFIQELFLGHVPLGATPPATLPPHAAAVSRLVGLLIYLFILGRLYLRRHEAELSRDLVLIALLGIVISPIAWTHYYTIALLPFLYLWCRDQARTNRTLLLLFLAIATNAVQLVRLPTTNPTLQLIFAAIIPALTLTLIYQALTPADDPLQSTILAEAR